MADTAQVAAWPAVVDLAHDVAAAVREVAAMMPTDLAAPHIAAADAMVVGVETAWAEQVGRWTAEAERIRAEAKAARGGMTAYEAERKRRGDD